MALREGFSFSQSDLILDATSRNSIQSIEFKEPISPKVSNSALVSHSHTNFLAPRTFASMVNKYHGPAGSPRWLLILFAKLIFPGNATILKELNLAIIDLEEGVPLGVTNVGEGKSRWINKSYNADFSATITAPSHLATTVARTSWRRASNDWALKQMLACPHWDHFQPMTYQFPQKTLHPCIICTRMIQKSFVGASNWMS